jgi:multidrug resistance protein, MATE family
MSLPLAPRAPDTSSRALLKLGWPLLIANVAVVGNGTIDTVMAGRLSAIDLAAVAVGSSIYVTVYIGLMGVLQALSPIAGHHFGAGRWRAIGDALQQALWLSGLLTLFGLPWLLATDVWIRLAGAEADVGQVARLYLHAIAFGLPAALATRVFVAMNAAVSTPKVTMTVNLVALSLKVPLNLVFMHGAGPIPPLGGAGAGVATALLSWLMLAMSFGIWRFGGYYSRFHSLGAHGPRWASLRELLKLGVPIGLSTMFEVTSFTFMAVLIARLGTVAVAGHQIVANMVAILFMIPLSLGIATSVLVAQSLGAGDARVARRAALRGFRIAMALALCAAIGIWAMREPLVQLYTSDPAVASVALSILGLAAIFHFFDAAQGISGFVLRGYKSTFWPMVIYGTALWGIGLGGGFWIGLYPTPFGPPRGPLGFWEAATVALGITAVLLSVLAATVSRRRLTRK